ncbi:MAG TPA: SpoIIE family protein phosphatase, partial [Labilithrix sp.]|nr:SpoIIE family protein phosphatase [Labilithrix sp.]
AERGVETRETRLIVTSEIFDNDGKAVGMTRVAFSLERENSVLARTRRDLAVGGAIVMVVTAALLIALTRNRLVRPLMGLVEVAKHIEQGDLKERAPERGDAEIATLARAFNNMGDAIAERERKLRRELQVAADLQLSILPKDAKIVGAQVAASMKPTTEVGGDYYDIIPTADGAWIGIGDVSGHGLEAGVIMLMIQSAVSALVACKPDASPVEVECAVNRVLYENIRDRMGLRDHATLSILRYSNDGTVRFAGAHEDLIVYRAATRSIETFETPGTWVGVRGDISKVTVESKLVLAADDVLVLYTDGVTEAMREGEQFGFQRLVEIVKRSARGAAHEVRESILGAVAEWTAVPSDDVSVVVLRQRPRG